MNSLLIKVLFLSLSGSVVALVLFALKPFLKLRVSKTWHYYIWLVVALRLLIPYTPEISLMNGLRSFIQNDNISGIVSSTAEEQNNTGAFDTSVFLATQYIWTIWLLIVVIVLLKKIVSYQVYVRFIKLNRKIITDENVIKIYEKACDKIKIKRKIGIYSYRMINSPMLIGFFNPYILLPETILQKTDELQYILLHELTHHKRKDFLYKWLIQIVLCVHFFNPIVFMIKNTINKNCELSCDEMVIKKLDVHSKKAYGTALINALEVGSGCKQRSAVELLLCEDVQQIKERLEAIIKYKKGSNRMILTTFSLTIMICFSAVYTGVYKINPGKCIDCHCKIF